MVHKDIAQKYKDAFKNLSQELKKKMNDVSNSKRQGAEDGLEFAQLNGSKSQESLENQANKRAEPDKQLSMKYLQASAGLDGKPFQSNVSNESFGPTKSSKGGMDNRMKQLGNLMRALQLDDGRPLHRTSSLPRAKYE